MNRHLIIPFLKNFHDNRGSLEFSWQTENQEEHFQILLSQGDSQLEKNILIAIRERGWRIPDEAQKVIYDGDIPVVKPDFYYQQGNKGICVFIDGPVHNRESIKVLDEKKRTWLLSAGYRVLSINEGNMDILKDID